MRTKLKARYVLGYDGQDHVLLPDAEVVYEDDSILFVGRDFPGDCDQVVDHGESLISPGFIDLDALGDIAYGLLEWELPARYASSIIWSEAYFARRKEVFTPEEEAFKSLYAYVQLIRNGITTAMPITCVYYKAWAETYEELAAAAEHAARLGLRAYLGPSYLSAMQVVRKDGQLSLAYDEAAGKAALDQAVRFVRAFDGKAGGLIRGALVPERIEYQTQESLLATRRAASELGCLIRLHAAQSDFEHRFIRKTTGKTPIQWLDELGFLAPDVSIPHVLFTQGYSRLPDKPEGDDLAILRDRGVSIIHCPLVYARHGRALESFGGYLGRGVNIALGTDTSPTDMFQVMRTGNAMAQMVNPGGEGQRCADFYRAATLGGARLLGRDDLGRLAPKAKADIIVIRLDSPDLGPVADPVRTLVGNGSGRDVDTVIINGRTVMAQRQIPGIDDADLRRKAQAYFDKLRQSYPERNPESAALAGLSHGEREEALFPPAFAVR